MESEYNSYSYIDTQYLAQQQAYMQQLQAKQAIEQQELYYPLVSCVVPTANRAMYLAQSVQYFMNQEYPNKELIIAYNKDSDIPDVYFPPEVKFVHCTSDILGTKRNEGTKYASGEIIAQWDDDDIYGPGRLSEQVFPIFLNQCDMTGLSNFLFYEIASGFCYKANMDIFTNAFQDSLACGTLVYVREIWDKLAKYPSVRSGEDYGFLVKSKNKKVRVMAINGYNSFIYIRHSKNTWQFEKDNFRRYEGWIKQDLPDWAQEYFPFYEYMGTVKNLPYDKNKQLVTTPR